MKKIWLTGLLAILLSVGSNAQYFRNAFNRISTDDGFGLASDHIEALYQDERGYLWVGGANGLQRYDGHKFINFQLGAPGKEDLPQVNITQLLGADSGRIWVAAAGQLQFGLFDPRKLTYQSVPLNPSEKLPARAEFRMWRDSKGNTYINVLRYGKVLVYDRTRHEFNENTPLNNLPAGWKVQLKSFEDSVRQQYWLVCDQGLAVYDVASGQMWHRGYNPKALPLLDNEAMQQVPTLFFIDSKRRHWLINWPGAQEVHCFDESGNELGDTAGITSSLKTYAEMAHMQQTRNGDVWLYGASNLFQLSSGAHRFQFYRDQYVDNYGIRYETVYDLCESKDGVIWLATDQGLYYTMADDKNRRRSNVMNLYLSQQPGEYEVTDVLQLKSGDYWISTWGRSIVALDSQFRKKPAPFENAKVPTQFTPAEQIGFRQIWALCQDQQTGLIWLGCQAGLIMTHDPATGKTTYLHPPEFDNRTIRYITSDRRGNIWFGTQGGRLIRYDGHQFKVMTQLENTAIIFKVFADSDGWIWLATQDRGAYAIDPHTGQVLQHYTREKGMSNNNPRDIEQLNDSLLYISADALNIVNKRTQKVQSLTTADGLPSNSIRRIRLDAKGYLWMITMNGLCRYDHIKHRFTTYGKKDGILLATITYSADYVCKNNYIMFVGPNSLMYFNPEGFYNNPPPPDVTITDFKLGNTYLPLDSLLQLQEIKLSADENNLLISFACLDFVNRDKYVYYYQLQGLDNEWRKADRLELPLTGLAPGHYTLRVKAENIDGLVSKNITELRFYIKPPFWRTGWFISTLLLIFTLIGYVIHRLRVNRLLAVETIRNRVARDLHDDMGSTLSTINILSSMAKTKMHTDELKAVEYINKISDNSQRMMEAMDDIVWAIKPSNDSMQRLVARLREFATNVFEAKDIDLEFTVSDEVNDVKLDMEARRDFFLIGKEAINNAAKYAQCQKVIITIEIINRQLHLLVKDDGIGFDVQQADGGNGMGNMQRRASSLRGDLKIQSQPGKGTVIHLQIPLP